MGMAESTPEDTSSPETKPDTPKPNRRQRRALFVGNRQKNIKKDHAKQQILTIMAMLLDNGAVVNFTGHYVKIDGHKFYRRHYVAAIDYMRKLRAKRRRLVATGRLPSAVTLREITEVL